MQAAHEVRPVPVCCLCCFYALTTTNQTKMSRIRILTTALAFALFLLPLSAQNRADTTYTFRFVPGKDMFYAPYRGNSGELERLKACVEQYKERILAGEIPVRVRGYAAGDADMAKIRSNRVKSELITSNGLVEACFHTSNHTHGGDSVVVTIIAPSKPQPTAPSNLPHDGEAMEDSLDKKDGVQEEQAKDAPIYNKVYEETETTAVGESSASKDETATLLTDKARNSSLFLRANLLRWATLTPDLGLEWHVNSTWAVLVQGSWTSWRWNDRDRRYALWEVSPEVRCYLGERKAWHIGAMGKVGHFNYKFSETGRQGDIYGGGITGGYKLPLGKRLALDFSLGLGYLRADYEKYVVENGVRVRAGKGAKDWWGPINAEVTLAWRIF